jgi:hypothetical protein
MGFGRSIAHRARTDANSVNSHFDAMIGSLTRLRIRGAKFPVLVGFAQGLVMALGIFTACTAQTRTAFRSPNQSTIGQQQHDGNDAH